jgi:hypothetical protein
LRIKKIKIRLEEEKVAPKKAREMRQKAREFFWRQILKGLQKKTVVAILFRKQKSWAKERETRI